MRKSTAVSAIAAVGLLPVTSPVVELASADDPPVLTLSFEVADAAYWDYRGGGTSSYFNTVDQKSCEAELLDSVEDIVYDSYYRVSVDVDCLDGLFIRGYGYGSADEDEILTGMSLEADSSATMRILSLPRSIQNGYYTRKMDTTDPGVYARLFDAAAYPCDRVIVGSAYPMERSTESIDRDRTLKCASDPERSGPGRRSVGYANDPVNTAHRLVHR